MIYTTNNPKLVRNYTNPEEDNFTGVVKDQLGHTAYYENRKLHRIDGPTVIWANGNVSWYYNHKFYGCDDEFTVESWIRKWQLEIFK